MNETLFPDFEPEVRSLRPSEQPGLSADRRRTLRQSEAIEDGIHPLTGGELHGLASRHRDAASPKDDPFTCGSCWFRTPVKHHDKTYSKCFQGESQLTYVTKSAATDVRAWWPACPSYSPSDSLSPDAARFIPDRTPAAAIRERLREAGK